MMIKTVTALSALSAASAVSQIPTDNIVASSRLGSRILSASKQTSRQLDNDNVSWVAGYSIVFQKCATTDEYYGGNFGGEEQNNDQQRYNYNGVFKQRLVHYKLCPTNSSGGCDASCSNGADYIIDMNLFVEAFLESKLEAQEYNCEQVRETCYQDNEYACYVAAGLDYCEDDQNNNNNNNNQNVFEWNLEEAARCDELDIDDDALQAYYYNNGGVNQGQNENYNYNNQNAQQDLGFFVGPYCRADGKAIHMGVFMDETCSWPAPSDTFSNFFAGQELPYAEENLIDDYCVSCMEPKEYDENNNGDQEDEDEVVEVCERLYEDAAKCEDKLADGTTYYPNTYGCEILKSLKKPGKMGTSSSGVSAAKVFAGLFAATTIVLGGVAYYMYDKSRRSNVALSADAGAMA